MGIYLKLPRDSVAPGMLRRGDQDKVSIQQMSASYKKNALVSLNVLSLSEGLGCVGVGGWESGRELLLRRDECWVGQPGIHLPQTRLRKLN